MKRQPEDIAAHAAIDLLRSLIAGDTITLTTVPWAGVLPLLRQHRLSAFVYAKLRRSSLWPDLPAAVRHELGEDFQQITIRAYRMEDELARVVQALAVAGIPVLLLKGAALGRTVYGSPAERPVSDFDLLVPRSAMQAACLALQARGYQAAGLYWLGQWQQRYRAELPLLHYEEDGLRLLVELHWSLLEAPFYMDHIPAAAVWQGAQPAADLPGARLPAAATLLIHACAHLALHHRADQGWFWLLDIDRLARWPLLDWSQVMEQAERWRLDVAVAMVVQQTVTLLATPLPIAVQQWLAKPRYDRAQLDLLQIGPQQQGRTWRKMRHTWQYSNWQQRVRYTAWLAVRGALWLPEQLQRQQLLQGERPLAG